MAAYPTAQDQATFAEDSEWVLADPGNVLATAAGSEINSQNLGLDVALAFPGLPKAATSLDAVLSVMAPTAEDVNRAPLRLVAVLDKSGSMQGEKLRLVIDTIKFMLQHLTERDALGLVAFDTSVTVLAPLTHCSSEGRSHLESVISRVTAGSQTNLSGGLLRGLELHREALSNPASQSRALQRIRFGNSYRKLDEPVEGDGYGRGPAPAGCERIHEWTMELQPEDAGDAALIEKVVYQLHDTFADPRVEVTEMPFRLTRSGWGLFKVRAEMHLRDGRVIKLEHDLCFDRPESFRTILQPLQPETTPSPKGQEDEDDQALVRSTFLFTDGAANVGIKTSDELCKALEAMSVELGSKQCTVSTFGFGADHSADLLRDVAKSGKGVYCFIENADSIGEAFGEALGGLLSVTHQNVRMCLELSPGVTLVKAKTSYAVENSGSSSENGQVVTINVGDLFAEERRDILIELRLQETDMGGEQCLGNVRASGFSVLNTRSETTAGVKLKVNRVTDDATSKGSMHPQVERHRNRYIASEALQSARTAGRRGNLEEARRMLQDAASELAASERAVQGCPLTLQLLSDVQECLADLRDDRTYTCSGSKKMAYLQMAHERQRTCGGASTGTYCNAMGFQMKSLGKEAVSTRSMP